MLTSKHIRSWLSSFWHFLLVGKLRRGPPIPQTPAEKGSLFWKAASSSPLDLSERDLSNADLRFSTYVKTTLFQGSASLAATMSWICVSILTSLCTIDETYQTATLIILGYCALTSSGMVITTLFLSVIFFISSIITFPIWMLWSWPALFANVEEPQDESLTGRLITPPILATILFFIEFVFPNNSLYKTDLSDSNLKGIDFGSLDLSEGNLKGADLREARLENVEVIGTQIDARTYKLSEWEPIHLVTLRDKGAIIVDPENLPPEARWMLFGRLEGLTLTFQTQLNPIDRFLIDMLAHAFNAQYPGANVRVVDFRERNETTLIRIIDEDFSHLSRFAEVVYQRVWQQSNSTATNTESPALHPLTRDLMAVVQPQMLRNLSWLVARAETFELWRIKDGKPQMTQEWTIVHSPSQVLLDLLILMFSEAEFRAFLSELPEGTQLQAHLPGGNASLADIMQSFIQILNRRNLLKINFFLRLTRERPERQGDVAYAARRWGIDLPATIKLPLPSTPSVE